MSTQATIVSLLPWKVDEYKGAGLSPCHFIIPPAAKDDFSLLNVGESTYHVYLDSDRGSLKQVHTAHEMAESIIADYLRAMAFGENTIGKPGLFWVPGSFTKPEIIKHHEKKLIEARAEHNKWAGKLVELADDSWSRQQERRLIPDTARLAAVQLGLNREWTKDVVLEQQKPCQFCGSSIRVSAVICPVCRQTVDAEGLARMSAGSTVQATK